MLFRSRQKDSFAPAKPPSRRINYRVWNSDTFETLLIQSRCSQEEIDAAGAGPLIDKASDRLSEVCLEAAEILKAYRISPYQLVELCVPHIEHGMRDYRESDQNVVRQVAEIWKLLAPFGVETSEIKSLMDDCVKNAWTPKPNSK